MQQRQCLLVVSGVQQYKQGISPSMLYALVAVQPMAGASRARAKEGQPPQGVYHRALKECVTAARCNDIHNVLSSCLHSVASAPQLQTARPPLWHTPSTSTTAAATRVPHSHMCCPVMHEACTYDEGQ